MMTSTWQQAHPLEFIGLQMNVTISCGIEILLCNAATRQVQLYMYRLQGADE